jgi:WhiB family transcriptional regulator, redox-sensing transcriptional regulator
LIEGEVMVPSMDWAADAACKGMDVNLFFPRKGGTARKAKALCAACPVIEQCRAAFDVMEHGMTSSIYGVVGGETVIERVMRRRAAAKERAA